MPVRTLDAKTIHIIISQVSDTVSVCFFFLVRNKLTAKQTHAHLITLSHQALTHCLIQSTVTKELNPKYHYFKCQKAESVLDVLMRSL